MFENKNNPCFDFEDLEELWTNLMDSTEKGDVDSIKKINSTPIFQENS